MTRRGAPRGGPSFAIQVSCLCAVVASCAVGLSSFVVGESETAQETRLRASLPGPAAFASGPRLARAASGDALDPVAENARCEACHATIAAEWASSQHHSAFVDLPFRAAYAVEPTAFCAGCHAPEDPAPDVGAAASRLGVGCVTCHLVGNTILAARHDGHAPAREGSAAPHRIARSSAFGGVGACAGCHDFSFGDDERRLAPLAMQSTAREHAASTARDRSCASCHLPLVGGRGAGAQAGARALDPDRPHRSHAFASTRDTAAHRRAVAVEVSRGAEGDGDTLRIALTLRDVGHAYPTGDLFRRVRVHAEVVGDDQQILAARTEYLMRHFGLGRGVDGRTLRVEAEPGDTRLTSTSAASARVFSLPLGPAARGRPIRYEVAYERVLHQIDGRPEEATLTPGPEGRIVLGAGVVDPRSSTP